MAKLLKYDGADVVAKYAENDTKGRKISTKIDEIDQKIADLKAVGRFLSVWDSITGLPMSNPPGTAPYDYTYQTGDYYIIGKTGTNNYKPSGTKYTGAASSVVESTAVYANDFYRYAGNGDWQLISSSQRTITFAMIEGEVNTNAKLKSALDAKQDKLTSTSKLSPSLIATDSSNRFVSDTEKNGWTGKQSALSSSNKLNPSYINWSDSYASVTKTEKDSWSGKQSALSTTNKLDPTYINWTTNYRTVTDTEKSTWNGKQDAITSSNKLDTALIATNNDNRFVTDVQILYWGGKQDALVSGTNIKSINGESILGFGDIEVTTDVSHLMPKNGGTFTGEVTYSSNAPINVLSNLHHQESGSGKPDYNIWKIETGTLGITNVVYGGVNSGVLTDATIVRGPAVRLDATVGGIYFDTINGSSSAGNNIDFRPGYYGKVRYGKKSSASGSFTYSEVATIDDIKITAEDYTIG